MPRDPIPTWFFALVVVRNKEGHYLLIHEAKHEQTWFLPAGRVEPGETFAAAAVRETLEESGVPVTLTGILRVEHAPQLAATRVRVIYIAEPASDVSPKSVADEESLEARWVAPADLNQYQLRSQIVSELVDYVENGGAVHPLSLMVWEGQA